MRLGGKKTEVFIRLIVEPINGKSAHNGVAQGLRGMGDGVGLIRCVFGMLGGAEQSGQRADQRGAIAADPKPRSCLMRGQIFPQNSPTGNAAIIRGAHGRHAGSGLHDLKAASARILTAVPQIRRSGQILNRVAAAKLADPQSGLSKSQFGRAKFPDHV